MWKGLYMTKDEIIKSASDRLMGWKLPRDFAPDGGITFSLPAYEGFDLPMCWPIGTNLLTHEQAQKMFEYCLGEVLDKMPLGPKC